MDRKERDPNTGSGFGLRLGNFVIREDKYFLAQKNRKQTKKKFSCDWQHLQVATQ